MEWCGTTFIFAVLVLISFHFIIAVLFIMILIVARVEFIHVRVRPNYAVEE